VTLAIGDGANDVNMI